MGSNSLGGPPGRNADLRPLLEAIARLLAPLVAAELATSAPASGYSTGPGGHLPPGRSRRWLREHARNIPGATRSGGRRGRGVVWSVTVADYDAWLSSTARAPVAPVVPDEWARAAGYRPTRGSR